MKTEKIENAVIESFNIFIERGALTSFLNIRLSDSAAQSFGGFYLDRTMALWIRSILRIAGVDDINDLAGKSIRIKYKDDSSIMAIGHFLNDDWFDPKKEFEDFLRMQDAKKS